MPCDCVSVKCGAVNGGSLKSEARIALRSAELYRHRPPFPGFQQLNFEAASLQHISQKSTKLAAPDYIDWSLVCWSLGTLYLLVLLNLAAALEIERNKGQAHGALLVPADGKRIGLFSAQLAGSCPSRSPHHRAHLRTMPRVVVGCRVSFENGVRKATLQWPAQWPATGRHPLVMPLLNSHCCG